MKRLRQYAGLLVLLLLIAASAWVTLSTEHSLRGTTEPKNSVDAYLTQVHYKQFNDLGKIALIMDSTRATLNKKAHTLTAENAVLTVFNNDGSYWKITGDHLIMDTQTRVFKLQGHTITRRPASAEKPSLVLTTDHLTLYPHDKALTDAALILTQGDGCTVSGTGGMINLKTNDASILANAHMLIIPRKKEKTGYENPPKTVASS